MRTTVWISIIVNISSVKDDGNTRKMLRCIAHHSRTYDFVLQPEGIFVQWKPSIEEDEGGGGNDGWAVVDAVSYKNDNASETG